MSKILFILGTATIVLNGVRPFGFNVVPSDLLYLGALYFLALEGIMRKEGTPGVDAIARLLAACRPHVGR